MGSKILLIVVLNLIIVLTLSSNNNGLVSGDQQVPCYFIFGDSLNDNGNNNPLPTSAKANYLPYGIDFPTGTNGRFTNSRNIADFIAELLGFKNSILPFTTSGNKDILKGRNYASGGGGIRDETARLNLGFIISMNGQLYNHKFVVSQITSMLKSKDEARKYLNQCIYLVSIGNNDYLNNYFMPNLYSTSRQFTPDQYAGVLVQQLSQQLAVLHSYGARKIAVFGLGPIGCAPAVVASSNSTGSSPCVDDINGVIQLFNAKLKPQVASLNGNLSNSQFTYIDTFEISTSPPSSLMNTNTSCCEYRSSDAMCVAGGNICPNRDDYAWWDGVHPTEASNRMSANRFYIALNPSDAVPYDIRSLALL
ncbi:hypothetical protein ACFE04_014456 [Oxalis oulophora]